MTCTYSFATHPDHLPEVQQIVKRHHQRFATNPAVYLKIPGIRSVPMTIQGDGAPFRCCVEEISALIARQPERVGFWKRMMGRLV